MLMVRLGWPSSCTSVTSRDAAHVLQHCLIALPFCSSVLRSEPKTLTASALFRAGLRLVHRVFRRLRVVEDDAGKRLRASC